jgi:DNA polymerase V
MMSVLQEFSPRLEIYSIDEAFLGLEGFNDQLVAHVHNIRNTLLTWTGIPVSIGVAPTKTLAKVANRLAKKDKASNGVRILMLPHEQHAALEHLTLDDIWGIARRMTQRLKTLDIHSPQELRATDTKFIRKNFGVTLERIVYELNGFSCLELEQIVSDRKSLIASQSFGHPVKIMDEMRQSIATHASRATEKMRRQNLATAHLIVFIETNPFQNTRPQYRAAQSLRLPVATSDTSRIVSGALKALSIIWRKDYDYKKGGVILLDLTPTSTLQEGLFDRSDTPASQSRMKALDALNNKYGKGTIVLGAASLRNGWSLRREYLSPNYTTNWQELLRV